MRQVLASALLVAALPLLGACASKPSRSGFLGGPDVYEALEQSDLDSSLWVTRKAGADLADYHSVMVDPVIVFLNREGDLADVDRDRMNEMATFFTQAMIGALQPAYPVVAEDGPGVLRIRAALTHVDPASPILNILPVGMITGSGLGSATMEVEFIDTDNYDRIAVVMATASGKRYQVVKGMSAYGQSEHVLDQWAKLIRERMDAAHGK